MPLFLSCAFAARPYQHGSLLSGGGVWRERVPNTMPTTRNTATSLIAAQSRRIVLSRARNILCLIAATVWLYTGVD